MAFEELCRNREGEGGEAIVESVEKESSHARNCAFLG